MNYSALSMAIGLCLISGVFEAFGASKKGKAWFENLRQPRFSFPFWVWYFIGGFYYVICGIVAYRIFLHSNKHDFKLSITLLIIMMFINGLTNYFLFKLRSLRTFYFAIYPFSVVTITLFVVLLDFDSISGWVLFPYLLWLIYDIYYFHFIWKLNQESISNQV